jgi:AbrB family looped-hinge helix DNA binding protein
MVMRNQEVRVSESEKAVAEYLRVRSNGQIILPASTRRKAKIKEGDLLEAVVDADGTIRLLPKLAVDRALAEQYQLNDLDWAAMQKEKKRVRYIFIRDAGS